jgi:hypothetical protein
MTVVRKKANSFCCVAAGTLLLSAAVTASELPTILQETAVASLPIAVTNNAVTTVAVDEKQYVISFLGLGTGKTHKDTLSGTMVPALDPSPVIQSDLSFPRWTLRP